MLHKSKQKISSQKKKNQKKRKKNNSKKQNQNPNSVRSQCKRLIYALKQSFSKIPEERRNNGGAFMYRMTDFIIAVIVAIVRGCYSQGDSIVEYWEANKGLLHSFGLFTNEEAKGRVPSLKSYYRLASILDSNKFGESLFAFVADITTSKLRKGLKVLAVDGKTMRGTSCGKLNRPIHILTAFCEALKIPINCVSCAEKSNEITAWQKLLDLLDDKCNGMVFTSDAMGCQVDIVKKIRYKGGDYCLALKGNQGNFEKEAKDMIARDINRCDRYTEKETLSHGRLEQRICTVYKAVPGDKNQYITDLERWPGIKNIIHIKATRIDKKTGRTSTDERIYISSLGESAEKFNQIIRSHWGVEIFHLILDQDFNQDNIKRRNDETSKASRNLDLFQKAAYIILMLYDILLSKLDNTRKPLGIRKMLHRTNASNQIVSDIFNLDIGWLNPT